MKNSLPLFWLALFLFVLGCACRCCEDERPALVLPDAEAALAELASDPVVAGLLEMRQMGGMADDSPVIRGGSLCIGMYRVYLAEKRYEIGVTDAPGSGRSMKGVFFRDKDGIWRATKPRMSEAWPK